MTPQELQALLQADPELAAIFEEVNNPGASMKSSDDTPTDRNELQRRRDERLQQLGLADQVPEGYGLELGGEVSELPGWLEQNWPLLALIGGPAAAQGLGALGGGAGAGTGVATTPSLAASTTLPAITGGTGASLAIPGAAAAAAPVTAAAGAGGAGMAAATGPAAAGAGPASAAAGGAKGLMGAAGKFLGSTQGMMLMSAIMSMLGGGEGANSFEDAKGPNRRFIAPSETLATAGKTAAGIGQGLTRKLSQPMKLQSPAPGQLSTMGFGQPSEAFNVELPGMDLGGLEQLFAGLNTPTSGRIKGDNPVTGLAAPRRRVIPAKQKAGY
jgi:hypothetical protein